MKNRNMILNLLKKMLNFQKLLKEKVITSAETLFENLEYIFKFRNACKSQNFYLFHFSS